MDHSVKEPSRAFRKALVEGDSVLRAPGVHVLKGHDDAFAFVGLDNAAVKLPLIDHRAGCVELGQTDEGQLANQLAAASSSPLRSQSAGSSSLISRSYTTLHATRVLEFVRYGVCSM